MRKFLLIQLNKFCGLMNIVRYARCDGVEWAKFGKVLFSTQKTVYIYRPSYWL